MSDANLNTYRVAVAQWNAKMFDWLFPQFNYWGYAREEMWKDQQILPNIPGW